MERGDSRQQEGESFKKMRVDEDSDNDENFFDCSDNNSLEDDDLYEEDDELDTDVGTPGGADSVDMEPTSSLKARVSDSAPEEGPYEVLNEGEVRKLMKQTIQQVSGILNLPELTTHLLLSYFQWDEARLVDTFYGGGDDGSAETLFRKAHIVNPYSAPRTSSIELNGAPLSADAKQQVLCEVCYLEVDPREMLSLPCCGKAFCRPCWQSYVTSKIVENGASTTISCISNDCDIYLNSENVRNVLQGADPSVLSKYENLLLSNFVLNSSHYNWCPSPDCSHAVKVHSLLEALQGGQAVSCQCGHTFCFLCRENAHAPVACHLLKKWMADDSPNCKWISVNAKNCPKCQVHIEKNGGCNYMVCSNRNCGQFFCWICLKALPERYAQHNCNRYQNPEEEKHKALLNRYIFYYDRFNNHRNSLKMENLLQDFVKEQMTELQDAHMMSWVEVQFLKKAVDTLCHCRRTLMYTYVFAFYGQNSQGNRQLDIFECNQDDLQLAVEKLSGVLEKEVLLQDPNRRDDKRVLTQNLTEVKQKVQDLTKYCEGRRKVLLDHVDEGHEKEWWSFPSSK